MPTRSRCSSRRRRSSSGAKVFTFGLKRNVHFADGTPLTSADVLWSLKRLQNLKGNPSFLLAGITVSAPSKYTVVMRSKTPATQLPVILANPSTGILNSALVQKNGGTDAANAAKADKAENWLNSTASAGAGSGPYTLSAYSTTSQITLVPNTSYWGGKKPPWASIVVRNMIAATQLLNVGRGSHEIAVDLSADQAQSLTSNKNVKVSLQPSTWIFFMWANANPKVSGVTSNPDFQKAIRYGLDYASLVDLAGQGAIQAPGRDPVDVPRLAPAERAGEDGRREGQGGARQVRRRRPAGDDDLPERPDDQRRAVHVDGAEGAVEPEGDRHERRALRLADVELAQRLPLRQGRVRPLALGPRLPGSRRLPRVHAGPARRPPRRLAGGQQQGDRGAREEGRRHHVAVPARRRCTGRSSGSSTRAARSSR